MKLNDRVHVEWPGKVIGDGKVTLIHENDDTVLVILDGGSQLIAVPGRCCRITESAPEKPVQIISIQIPARDFIGDTQLKQIADSLDKALEDKP